MNRTPSSEPDPGGEGVDRGGWLWAGAVGPGRHRGAGRGRGRGRRGWPGPPDFDWGAGPVFGRGPRASRGDVRAAVLFLLGERPMHGYQIMSEIRERSGGSWRPSPGSVYPTLQQLDDEGLVTSDTSEGRRVFRLTEEGEAAVARMPEEPPWETTGGDPDLAELRRTVGQVATAAIQVAQVGSRDQIQSARQILVDARRQLYRLLAEDDGGTDPDKA